MDDEDTPLISSEGIRGRNVNTAPDLEDVDLSDEPPRQPPQTSSSIPRPTGNQIAAGGAAVAAGAAIGASTYIEATTRAGPYPSTSSKSTSISTSTTSHLNLLPHQ